MFFIPKKSCNISIKGYNSIFVNLLIYIIKLKMWQGERGLRTAKVLNAPININFNLINYIKLQWQSHFKHNPN